MKLKILTVSGLLCISMLFSFAAVYAQGVGDPGWLWDNMEPGNELLFKPSHSMDRGIIYNDIGEIQSNSRTYGYWQANQWPYLYHGYWGQIYRVIPAFGMPPGDYGLDIPSYEFPGVDRSMHYNVLELIQPIIIQGQPVSIWWTDWEAKDFNLSRAMGGPDGARTSWGEPLIAISPRGDSWPEGYYGEKDVFAGSGVWTATPGERHWPGRWASNADTKSEDYGQPQIGQFAADQVGYWSEYDKYAGIRPGDAINTGYPVGFDMEMHTYAYASPLTRDILYWDLDFVFMEEDWVRAPNGVEADGDPYRHIYTGTIDSLYLGWWFYTFFPDENFARGGSSDARPYAQDMMVFFDGSDPRGDLLWFYHKYGEHTRQWGTAYSGMVSAYSFYFPQTPEDRGITSLHYFDETRVDDWLSGQSWERKLYGMMAGQPWILLDDTGYEASEVFHPAPVAGDEPDWQFDNLDSMIHWLDYRDDGTLRRNSLDGRSQGWRVYTSYMAGTGPFSMSSGDTAHVTFCAFGALDNPGPLAPGSVDDRKMEEGDRWPVNDPVRFGKDPHDRFKNVYELQETADALYVSFFRGSGPPSSPTLWAKGTMILDENEMPLYLGYSDAVTLYWDNVAEMSMDYGTKIMDFQGYRLFKREFDPNGATEWELLDQWDKIDGLTGWDPIGVDLYLQTIDIGDEDLLLPEHYMGDDTGIEHRYYDGNLINGMRYDYCLVAYDDWDSTQLLPSSQTLIGTNPRYKNFVRIKPTFQPLGYVEGDTLTHIHEEDPPQLEDRISYPHPTGIATGEIDHRVIDELLVKSTVYTISFSKFDYVDPVTKDTTFDKLGYNVYDNTTGIYVLENIPYIYNDEELDDDTQTKDFYPFFDGIGIAPINYTEDDPVQFRKRWTDEVIARREAAEVPDYYFNARDEDEDWEPFGHGHWYFSDLVYYDADEPAIYEMRYLGPGADSGYVPGAATKDTLNIYPFQIWDITDSVYKARQAIPDYTGETYQMLLKPYSGGYWTPFRTFVNTNDRIYFRHPNAPNVTLWYITVDCPVVWELDEDAFEEMKLWQNDYSGVFPKLGDIREVAADIREELIYVNDTTFVYVIDDIDTTVVPPDTTYVIDDIDTTVVPPDTTYVIDHINVEYNIPTYVTTLDLDTLYWTQDSLDSHNPSVGDKFIWKTEFPFSEEDTYEFQTSQSHIDQDEFLMDRIAAIPNPYVVSSPIELFVGTVTWNRREIRFINLPEECTIDIYTLTGDRVRTIEHKDNTGGFKIPTKTVEEHLARFPTGVGEATWDLLTYENLEVSYGVYIYVVKTNVRGKEEKFMEKLVIIK